MLPLGWFDRRWGWGHCELRNVLEESEFRWIWIRGIRTFRSEAAVGLPLSPFRAVLPLVVLFPVGSTVSGGVVAGSISPRGPSTTNHGNCKNGTIRRNRIAMRIQSENRFRRSGRDGRPLRQCRPRSKARRTSETFNTAKLGPDLDRSGEPKSKWLSLLLARVQCRLKLDEWIVHSSQLTLWVPLMEEDFCNLKSQFLRSISSNRYHSGQTG